MRRPLWLVDAPEQPKGERPVPNAGFYPNLGISAIQSYISEAHGLPAGAGCDELTLVDGALRSFEEVEQQLDTVPPGSLVGFYAQVTNYGAVCALSSRLKARLGDQVMIVCGGPWGTALPEVILETNLDIDACVAGDGEEIMLRLSRGESARGMNGFFCRGEKGRVDIPEHCISHLDIGPLPPPLKHTATLAPYFANYAATDPGDHRRPTATYFSKAGCHNRCIFCSVSRFGKVGPSRERQPEEAWLECMDLRDRLGVNHIFEVTDSVLPNRCEALAALAPRHNADRSLSFRFYANTDFIAHEEYRFLDHFVEIGGATLAVGFESNDELVLRHAKSGRTTPEQNAKALRQIVDRGLELVAFFVLGLPFETHESLKKTREFIEKVAQYERTTFLLVAAATPLPGTLLWDKYVRGNRSLRRKYVQREDASLVAPVYDVDELSRDYMEHCPDVRVGWDEVRELQLEAAHTRPDVFSVWGTIDE